MPFRPVERWKELSPKPSRIEKSCARFQICETTILNQSGYTCLHANIWCQLTPIPITIQWSYGQIEF
jgi:hypothetical protein